MNEAINELVKQSAVLGAVTIVAMNGRKWATPFVDGAVKMFCDYNKRLMQRDKFSHELALLDRESKLAAIEPRRHTVQRNVIQRGTETKRSA